MAEPAEVLRARNQSEENVERMVQDLGILLREFVLKYVEIYRRPSPICLTSIIGTEISYKFRSSFGSMTRGNVNNMVHQKDALLKNCDRNCEL